MPVEMYNPLDLKVGDIVGKSVGHESQCIAKITLVVMQHKDPDKTRVIDPIEKLDSVTREDVVRFYEIAKTNQLNTIKAIKEYEEDKPKN